VSLTEADGGLRARKRQQLREAIYDAALELFADRPYDEVTVEEICERADVGRATFFRVYGTKAGLLVELNSRLGRRIAERLADDAATSAIEQLWAVQDEVTRTWADSAPALRSLAVEYFSTTAASRLAERNGTGASEAIADVVRRGQASGEINDLHDPDLVAGIILSTLAVVTMAWINAGGRTSLEALTRNTLALLLDGLASRRR